jgi:hypothetical protein
MRAVRILCLSMLLVSLLSFGPLRRLRAQRSMNPSPEQQRASAARFTREAFAGSESSSLREVIDDKYKKRYKEWKDEFLSTEIGRAQWDLYSQNPRLVLTIRVAPGDSHGAGSGSYKWNDAGELIAATITLGTRIDEGFPSSIYYPVMNSIEPFEATQMLSKNVLAATKIAHEFGHVIKMGTTPADLYHLQVKLVPLYNKIFLSNGHNVNDPRLVEMAKQMGGNPVEIWEDREYWGEANAMLYLRDRVAKESFHCRLFNKIKRSVEEYARNYEERFTEIAKSQGVTYSCSWK